VEELKKVYLPIHCRLRPSETFDKSYPYKPVKLEDGITALVGIQKGQDNVKVQTLLFNTNPESGSAWSLRKAKEWIKLNKSNIKAKVFLKDIVKNVSVPSPKIISGDKLSKAVERLSMHFKQPKIKNIRKEKKGA